MNYRTEEIITNIGFAGSIAISLVACTWFCVSQHKLVKNTGRLADVFERLENKGKL
nr:MAG TPA: hypothetical protein [Caudoviricetes sp.]